MRSDEVKKILKENQEAFEILKRYDKFRDLPFHRKRIDITLPVVVINRLKKLKEQTGKPISRLIEEKF